MPSWPRMTIQVDPQIAVKMMKGRTTERSPSSSIFASSVLKSRGMVERRYATCISKPIKARLLTIRGAYALSQRRDRGCKSLNRLAGMIPACHEADFARSPIVKIETLIAQARGLLDGNI